MKVLDYGSLILCKNITFEDNKYDLEENGHMGVVLLPTTEKQDEVYCIYMTSSKKRAGEESYKYIKYSGNSLKESFVNIQQIIKRENRIDVEYDNLDDEKFYELLSEFYKYQLSINPQREYFLEVKRKIKVLLECLKINKEEKIKSTRVTREEIDALSKIDNEDKRKTMYLINKIDSNRINFKNKTYYEKLIELCSKLKEIDVSKLNLQDLNNEMRNIYFILKNNNYMLNANNLFQDASILLSMSNNNELVKKIEEFIAKESEMEDEKNEKKEIKRQKKYKKNSERKIKATKQNEENRIRKLKEKYGNFDAEYFK